MQQQDQHLPAEQVEQTSFQQMEKSIFPSSSSSSSSPIHPNTFRTPPCAKLLTCSSVPPIPPSCFFFPRLLHPFDTCNFFPFFPLLSLSVALCDCLINIGLVLFCALQIFYAGLVLLPMLPVRCAGLSPFSQSDKTQPRIKWDHKRKKN